jgi:hypothetical protein
MLFVYFGFYEDGMNSAGQNLGYWVMVYSASTIVISTVMCKFSLNMRYISPGFAAPLKDQDL